MHIYKFYARNVCKFYRRNIPPPPLSMIYNLFSPTSNHSLLFKQHTISDSSKRVTSTWPYTRIRSKREVFHWREGGGGRRWRTAAMIIITGHWGCARVEGCIVSGRGHRWQAPRFQRGAPRPTLQPDRYFPVPQKPHGERRRENRYLLVTTHTYNHPLRASVLERLSTRICSFLTRPNSVICLMIEFRDALRARKVMTP